MKFKNERKIENRYKSGYLSELLCIFGHLNQEKPGSESPFLPHLLLLLILISVNTAHASFVLIDALMNWVSISQRIISKSLSKLINPVCVWYKLLCVVIKESLLFIFMECAEPYHINMEQI